MTTVRAARIAGFSVTTPDAARLLDFYSRVFGVTAQSSERLEGHGFERCLGVGGGAWRHVVPFGSIFIEFLQFDARGRRYPYAAGALDPRDPIFQHFAVIVSDMPQAMAALEQAAGWTPLTHGGPQLLPPRSGGVTAFKFQDPDGHPLEFLAFPPQAVPAQWQTRSAASIFLGIDHSAISVADTAASAAFYSPLGFAISAQTQNHGSEQAALDGVTDAHVEVTALSIARSTPHLELLCYRPAHRRDAGLRSSPANNDVAAARVLLTADASAPGDAARAGMALASGTAMALRDPDGHHLIIF